MVLNGTLMTNSPAYTKSVKEEDKKKFDQSTTDDIDAKAMETIDQHLELTDAQYKHAIKIANAYKDVVLFNDESGKQVTIESLLNSSPDDTVSSSSLDFLKGQIPDESMLKSSVANFDKEYMCTRQCCPIRPMSRHRHFHVTRRTSVWSCGPDGAFCRMNPRKIPPTAAAPP